MKRPSEAKVDQLNVPISCEHDVLKLQIIVKKVVVVHVLNSKRHFSEKHFRLRFLKAFSTSLCNECQVEVKVASCRNIKQRRNERLIERNETHICS